ncbi:hypothetical protein [Dietzia sp.]|uniref:hypothetical protein n=1 Tax=Dietzia sp. TaxID=1871616 RepID=UPI002FD94164
MDDLGFQEPMPGVFTVKVHAGEGAVGRRTVTTTVMELPQRLWLDCFYVSEVDVSDIDSSIPDEFRTDLWLPQDEDAEGRRWAELFRTRPFDVTETEVTTAGITGPVQAETIAEAFVVAPIAEAFDGEIAPRWSTSGLATVAVTPSDGYTLSPRTWRTATVVLAASGYLDLALETIDRVAESPRRPEDDAASVRRFREWIEGADLAAIAGWDLPSDGEGEAPRLPVPGEVRPARALWRFLGDGSVAPTLTSGPVLPLTESFLGRDRLEEWLKGMGALEAEFSVYDIRGAVGDVADPRNARLVERHLVDTFGSWARATRPEHRDLLDRYQRHLGEMVLRIAEGEWIERKTVEGVLDPVVKLADGTIVDPTAVATQALTTKSGGTYEQLLGSLGYAV